MRQSLVQLSLLLAAVCACADARALSTGKLSYAADVFYGKSSAVLSQADNGIEVLACRASRINLEVIIAVGHADRGEADTKNLSEQRAHGVRLRLMQLGVPGNRIYVEGKGDSQPVSADDPSLNRRVELEMTGTSAGLAVAECDNTGSASQLDMTPAAYMAAHVRVAKGEMVATDPAVLAIQAGRMDLLDSVLAGPGRIALDREDRMALMHRAIRAGDPRFVARLVSFGILPAELAQRGAALAWAVCDGYGVALDDGQRVRMVEALLSWGDRPAMVKAPIIGERSALQCASQRNLPLVLARLLAAGADPDLPLGQPPVIAGALHPAIVRSLVAGGANPAVRLADGTTLAHRYRLTSATDVEWLAKLGLDLNARDASGYTPLHTALRYASPDILDALVASGAAMAPGRPFLSASALYSNLPGLVWLIDKGAAQDSQAGIALSVASHGDAAVPVIEALRRRGIGLSESDQAGATALVSAIRAWSPELVSALLQTGVLRHAARAASVREVAERLEVHLVPGPYCVDCFPAAQWHAKEMQRLNPPERLAERQRRKDQIIALLKAAEAALPAGTSP